MPRMRSSTDQRPSRNGAGPRWSRDHGVQIPLVCEKLGISEREQT